MKQLTLLFWIAVSCTHHITEQGRQVRLVTANQKENMCEFLDIITVSSESGWDSAHDRSNAINQARNEVARLGGNGMFIITNANDNEGFVMSGNMMVSASTAVIQAEALSCNFTASNTPKKLNMTTNTKTSNIASIVAKKSKKKTVELGENECIRASDCETGFFCNPIKGQLPGICTDKRSVESLGCMSDSDCPSGKVCATVQGEYPGSCARGGFGF